MANWIVGGIVAIVVGLVIWKMLKDKKNGKGGCSCNGNCSVFSGCH